MRSLSPHTLSTLHTLSVRRGVAAHSARQCSPCCQAGAPTTGCTAHKHSHTWNMLLLSHTQCRTRHARTQPVMCCAMLKCQPLWQVQPHHAMSIIWHQQPTASNACKTQSATHETQLKSKHTCCSTPWAIDNCTSNCPTNVHGTNLVESSQSCDQNIKPHAHTWQTHMQHNVWRGCASEPPHCPTGYRKRLQEKSTRQHHTVTP